LAEEIRELAEEIRELETKNTELEAKNCVLEAKTRDNRSLAEVVKLNAAAKLRIEKQKAGGGSKSYSATLDELAGDELESLKGTQHEQRSKPSETQSPNERVQELMDRKYQLLVAYKCESVAKNLELVAKNCVLEAKYRHMVAKSRLSLQHNEEMKKHLQNEEAAAKPGSSSKRRSTKKDRVAAVFGKVAALV